MKTTLEIPDELLEEAAAAKGEKPWMASFGKLSSLRSETARINRVIEEEFGQVSS
jgi:hypothetical protein